jgi:hypothetical protein
VPQEQRTVPLVFIQDEERKAVATGNNAAWMCVCNRKLPLIGRSDEIKNASLAEQVHCPECGKHYLVVAKTTRMTQAIKVIEIE